MAKTVPLDPPTLEWARCEFGRYYSGTRVDPPTRFARREFAAFPFSTETLMRRHASFRSPEEFRDFLVREVPRHVYYSSAYYRQPANLKMADKDWLGADLIFDLDSDHLRKAEGLDYAEQLRLVKEKLRLLLDDFLFGDFGIDPKTTSIVFSGGRGYHVHVRENSFVSLTSPERRELVEYIQGSGFDPGSAVEERRERADEDAARSVEGQRRNRPRVFHALTSPDSPGWRGRTTRAVLLLLQRWELEGSVSAAAELEGLGAPPAKAKRWAKMLVEGRRGSQIRETLSLEVFPKEVPKEFLDIVLRQAAIEVQGETDAPVTTDIHRLIRLPGSLHGGTGFRVVPLDRESLDGFDPLRDALLPVPREERIPVRLLESVRYPFAPDPVRGSPGDLKEVPTPQALFLVLRGEARLQP